MVGEEKQFDPIEESMIYNPGGSQHVQDDASAEVNPNDDTAPVAEASVTDQNVVDQEVVVEVPGLTSEDPGNAEVSQVIAEYQAKIDTLTKDVESLKAQTEERTAQYMRIAADFDNFRKRTQKEKEDLEQQIKCSTVIELLPVVDNFERARSQIKPQSDSEMNIHKSYQGVYKDLVERLKRIGVSPMRAEGKEFDPNLHEAVMREPTEEYEEGTVMEELVRGYVLGERVLRHAMVKVAAAPEPAINSGQDNNEGNE